MIRNHTFGDILPNVEYTDREGVYGIVMNKENQIALIESPRGLFLPGGGIEADESHAESLVREFLEETGYSIVIEGYFDSASLYDLVPSVNRYLRMVGHFYVVHLENKSVMPTEVDHKFVWHRASEAPKLLKLEHQAWVVQRFLEVHKTK